MRPIDFPIAPANTALVFPSPKLLLKFRKSTFLPAGIQKTHPLSPQTLQLPLHSKIINSQGASFPPSMHSLLSPPPPPLPRQKSSRNYRIPPPPSFSTRVNPLNSKQTRGRVVVFTWGRLEMAHCIEHRLHPPLGWKSGNEWCLQWCKLLQGSWSWEGMIYDKDWGVVKVALFCNWP